MGKAMMIRIMALVLLVAALPAAGFGADDLGELERSMAAAGFDDGQVEQVRTMIEQAGQQGLPAEAVAAKVREGIAKRVPAARITAAAERVMDRYAFAYALARREVKEPDRAAEIGRTIASALAAGLSREDAQAVAGTLAERAPAMPAAEFAATCSESWLTARDMARRGVSSATTAEAVRQAVQQGYRAGAMRRMRNDFNSRAGYGDVEAMARGAAGGMGGAGEAGSMGRGGAGSMGGSGHGGGSGGSGGGHR